MIDMMNNGTGWWMGGTIRQHTTAKRPAVVDRMTRKYTSDGKMRTKRGDT